MEKQQNWWECKTCGACIGVLGLFLRGLVGHWIYGRLIGCNRCCAPQGAPHDR